MNFILSLLLFLVWIWGVVITIKYWDEIPLWAKVLAILGILTGGGPFTILIVYIGWATNS